MGCWPPRKVCECSHVKHFCEIESLFLNYFDSVVHSSPLPYEYQQCRLWTSVECVWVHSVECEDSSVLLSGECSVYRVWSGDCGVWSVECECREWSVECRVWTGVWSVECRVWSAECKVWSLKCKLRRKKFDVWSVKCKGQSAECEVWSGKCER